MPSYKDFTGTETKNLEGMDGHVGHVLAQSELGGKSDGYTLDHANTPGSGFTFGGNQMDLASGKSEYKDILKDIITNATNADGKPIVPDSKAFFDRIETALESVGNPHAISAQDKAIINQAFSSEYGKEQINNAFVTDITQNVNHVHNFIDNLPHGGIRDALDSSQEMQIYLSDYHNQLDLSQNGPMAQFLGGKEVQLQNGKTFQLHENITPQELLEFIQNQAYFQGNPSDFDRRYFEIDKQYIDNHVHPDLTNGHGKFNIDPLAPPSDVLTVAVVDNTLHDAFAQGLANPDGHTQTPVHDAFVNTLATPELSAQTPVVSDTFMPPTNVTVQPVGDSSSLAPTHDTYTQPSKDSAIPSNESTHELVQQSSWVNSLSPSSVPNNQDSGRSSWAEQVSSTHNSEHSGSPAHNSWVDSVTHNSNANQSHTSNVSQDSTSSHDSGHSNNSNTEQSHASNVSQDSNSHDSGTSI